MCRRLLVWSSHLSLAAAAIVWLVLLQSYVATKPYACEFVHRQFTPVVAFQEYDALAIDGVFLAKYRGWTASEPQSDSPNSFEFDAWRAERSIRNSEKWLFVISLWPLGLTASLLPLGLFFWRKLGDVPSFRRPGALARRVARLAAIAAITSVALLASVLVSHARSGHLIDELRIALFRHGELFVTSLHGSVDIYLRAHTTDELEIRVDTAPWDEAAERAYGVADSDQGLKNFFAGMGVSRFVRLSHRAVEFMLAALIALFVYVALRQRWAAIEALKGCCVRCGYDLRGGGVRCSECGLVSAETNTVAAANEKAV